MADKDKKSLADLAALTSEPAEAPAAEPAAEEAAAPEAQTETAAEAEAEAAAPEVEAVAAEAPAAEAAPAERQGRRGRDKEEDPNKDGVLTQGPQIQAVLREQQLDKQGRAYATGRRKDAVARVWLKPGSGKIVINEKTIETYFARPVLRMLIQQPFAIANRAGQFDVTCTVSGGGLSGQAGALRHGISKALTFYEPDLRGVLKKGGFMTRDSRVVERKKYGRKKARRSFQFSKR